MQPFRAELPCIISQLQVVGACFEFCVREFLYNGETWHLIKI
jgi:hypothetical protein